MIKFDPFRVMAKLLTIDPKFHLGLFKFDHFVVAKSSVIKILTIILNSQFYIKNTAPPKLPSHHQRKAFVQW